jgi:hypothetical protein
MGAITNAAGPALGQITKGAAASKANILNNTPAGAGRDYAAAMTEVGKNQQLSSTIGQIYNSAFPALQGISQQQAGTGLSQVGQGLQGFGGNLTGNQTLVQAGVARQQAKSQMFGQIFQAAGTAAGGFSGGSPSGGVNVGQLDTAIARG